MCTQFPRFRLFFFFFFFDLRLVSLEPRFKFQRALRPKEEDRRGPDKLSRRGLQRMASHLLDLFWVQRMGSHCYYFVIVLVLAYVVIVVCCLADLHAGPSSSRSSHHGHRDFLLVLRLYNNGLNQCCVIKNIAFAFNYFYYFYQSIFLIFFFKETWIYFIIIDIIDLILYLK